MARVKRRARNQQLFREVNERIAELSAGLAVETQEFFCECAQTGCSEMLNVPAEVYGRVRSDPSHYLVRPGHQDPTEEEIVEDAGGYLIIKPKPGVVTGDLMSPTASTALDTS